MQINPPKAINAVQLQQELATAGIVVPSIGTQSTQRDGLPTEVHTYTPGGAITDLPSGAAAVVAAHVAQPDPSIAAREQAIAHLLDPASGFSLTARQAFAVVVGAPTPST